jgi:FKBP-type peptidyl-prolyl cis-trans isomerase
LPSARIPAKTLALAALAPHPAHRESTMSSELQIEDIVVGDGKAVVKGALITTQYKGTLEDGTVFDSSYDKGRPFQCVIGTGRVIKGWEHNFHK